jgi:hypothetical protein
VVVTELSGLLLFAGWRGVGPPELPGFSLHYEPEDCRGRPRTDWQISSINMALVLGDGTVISPGTTYTTETYVIGNGQSWQGYASTATDQPSQGLEGSIARK